MSAICYYNTRRGKPRQTVAAAFLIRTVEDAGSYNFQH